MNYLAHLFLAQNTPESRLGNLLGDFVKGSLHQYRDRYSVAILEGLQTHRLVDQYTDHHPVYRQSRHRVNGELNLFSGIAIDIYYDHFLACHWQDFSTQTRAEFTAEIYLLLRTQQHLLPSRLQTIVPRILQEDWLNNYHHWSGIQHTFARLHQRIKRTNPLLQATPILQAHYSELEADFLLFFPDLVGYARSLQGASLL